VDREIARTGKRAAGVDVLSDAHQPHILELRRVVRSDDREARRKREGTGGLPIRFDRRADRTAELRRKSRRSSAPALRGPDGIGKQGAAASTRAKVSGSNAALSAVGPPTRPAPGGRRAPWRCGRRRMKISSARRLLMPPVFILSAFLGRLALYGCESPAGPRPSVSAAGRNRDRSDGSI
jgi:hypothetical protein